MTEFMEDGGDFVMRQQGLLIIHRRCKIPAHQTKVRRKSSIGTGPARAEEIHPGPAAL